PAAASINADKAGSLTTSSQQSVSPPNPAVALAEDQGRSEDVKLKDGVEGISKETGAVPVAPTNGGGTADLEPSSSQGLPAPELTPSQMDNLYMEAFKLLHGVGGKLNFKRAAELCKMLVEHGHVRAHCCLASMYESGRGVTKNLKEAARL